MPFDWALAALGNPGQKYSGTRHNCGFMLADKLLREAGERGAVQELGGRKFNALLWKLNLTEGGEPWLLIEPQTFMNESGRAIQPALAWHNIPPGRLVVAQDELDIPAGSLRFKFGGGLAGHNGLASIAQCLGTPDFYRLRVGVGRPLHKSEVINWVLSRPDQEDRAKIEKALDAAVETLRVFSREGLKAAELYAKKH